MKIVEKTLDEIYLNPDNPRLNEGAVDAVAESINAFGFKVPIVVNADGKILAGNTRYKAAQRLGLAKVPCVVADDLDEVKQKAFILADNKTSELAEWDFELLEKELAELSEMDFDMSAFGFDDEPSLPDEREKDSKDDDEGAGYKIVYEIAFNNEDEQSEWYDFLSELRETYPDCETISERILCAVREWRNGKGN